MLIRVLLISLTLVTGTRASAAEPDLLEASHFCLRVLLHEMPVNRMFGRHDPVEVSPSTYVFKYEDVDVRLNTENADCRLNDFSVTAEQIYAAFPGILHRLRITDIVETRFGRSSPAYQGIYNDKRVVIYVMGDHAEVGISIFEN